MPMNHFPRPWTLFDYADLVERVLDERGVESCHIIAHSFGARVTAILVNRNPSRYRRLVLVGAAGIPPRRSVVVRMKILWHKFRRRVFGRETEGGSAEYRVLTKEGKITFQNIIRHDLRPLIRNLQHPTLLIYGSKDTATPVWMGRKWMRLMNRNTSGGLEEQRYSNGNTSGDFGGQRCSLVVYENSGHYAYLEESARFIADAFTFLNSP